MHKKIKGGGLVWDIWRKEMGRGRMEEPNLGFWCLAAHHQGNCVAVATAKPASHFPRTSSATVPSTPARHFRVGGCGLRKRLRKARIAAAVANRMGSVAKDAKEELGFL